MADIKGKKTTGTRAAYKAKICSVTKMIPGIAMCTTFAFIVSAQAQSWLSNTIGSVAGQVEQGAAQSVQQHILGEVSQPQQAVPATPPVVQPVQSNAAQIAPNAYPSGKTSASQNLPPCSQAKTWDGDGYVHHQACTPSAGAPMPMLYGQFSQ